MRTTSRTSARLLASAWMVILLLAGSTAWADGLMSYSLRNAVLVGEDRPAVIVDVGQDFSRLTLELERDDGHRLEVGGRAASRGDQVVLAFDQPKGTSSYRARLIGTYQGNSGEARRNLDFRFEAFVGDALELQVPRDAIEISRGYAEFTLSRAPVRYEVQAIGLEGVLGESQQEVAGAGAGEPIPVEWRIPRSAELVRLDIRAYDRWGFWAEELISPWSLEIPHEEVVFDSGAHDVRSDQEGKLASARDIALENINRYGHLIQIKLFVAGYTDTVGDGASNQALSERRARSIASWFARNGVTVEIHYQGFGEGALAVTTDDGVDEERNRRAIYLLSTRPPAPGGSFPGSRWRPLR